MRCPTPSPCPFPQSLPQPLPPPVKTSPPFTVAQTHDYPTRSSPLSSTILLSLRCSPRHLLLDLSQVMVPKTVVPPVHRRRCQCHLPSHASKPPTHIRTYQPPQTPPWGLSVTLVGYVTRGCRGSRPPTPPVSRRIPVGQRW